MGLKLVYTPQKKKPPAKKNTENFNQKTFFKFYCYCRGCCHYIVYGGIAALNICRADASSRHVYDMLV